MLWTKSRHRQCVTRLCGFPLSSQCDLLSLDLQPPKDDTRILLPKMPVFLRFFVLNLTVDKKDMATGLHHKANGLHPSIFSPLLLKNPSFSRNQMVLKFAVVIMEPYRLFFFFKKKKKVLPPSGHVCPKLAKITTPPGGG